MGLVEQTFNFPQEGLEVKEGYLHFNELDLKALIDKYGTPLKISYLPKIGSCRSTRQKTMFAGH
jgi:arginine decarboxylase